MCGIAGVIGLRDDGALLRRMLASLRHRGPNGTGSHSEGACHLGATRLAVTDPAAGPQPVFDEDRRIAVVLNGEIYNHRELREGLRQRGHRFRTLTDTEVIVHLYQEEGDACLDRLDGMFSLALLDGPRLLLARDRLGIKPLYVAHLAEQQLFLFGSEIKALLCHPGLRPAADLQTLADATVLGTPLGDQTYLQRIRVLRPGHSMVVRDGSPPKVGTPVLRAAHRPPRAETIDLRDATRMLGVELERAVAAQLCADVPVGLTLSGGIDSTVLTLLASEQSPGRLPTFTVADHPEHVELEQAALVARLAGTEHRPFVLDYDDFLATIPALVAAEEQPSSLYGAPFHFLCRQVARRCPVILHGEGADELFGGYDAYVDRVSRLRPIGNRLPKLRALGMAPSQPALRVIDALTSPDGHDEYLRRLFDWNMADPLERQHLVPVDACAMASGVEVRVPYLDRRLVGLVEGLPISSLVRTDLGVRKYLLRRYALERWGAGVCDAVLREKIGAPSAGSRHLKRFARTCEACLPPRYLERHELGGFFGSARELLLFELFVEIMIDRRGDPGDLDLRDFLAARGASDGAATSTLAERRAVEELGR